MLALRRAIHPLLNPSQLRVRKSLHVLTSAAKIDSGNISASTRWISRAMSSSPFDPAANLPPRSESDSMGSLPIAAGTLWGCQTQRSLGNFKIGGIESKS